MLNSNLEQIYTGEPNRDFLSAVKDCTFVYNPLTKRVNFQIVANIKKTINDWAQVVTIPAGLQIANAVDSYCGTAFTNGEAHICYISPSFNGCICPGGIANAPVGSTIKIIGSYFTSKE